MTTDVLDMPGSHVTLCACSVGGRGVSICGGGGEGGECDLVRSREIQRDWGRLGQVSRQD